MIEFFMFEKILEKEKIAQELVYLTNYLEKIKMDFVRLKSLEEDLGELNKENKEILFKVSEDILKSSKTQTYYYTPGYNIFIETNYLGLKDFITRKLNRLEEKEKELGKSLLEMEKKLVELDKEINQHLEKSSDKFNF